jgi:hypothetical protein
MWKALALLLSRGQLPLLLAGHFEKDLDSALLTTTDPRHRVLARYHPLPPPTANNAVHVKNNITILCPHENAVNASVKRAILPAHRYIEPTVYHAVFAPANKDVVTAIILRRRCCRRLPDPAGSLNVNQVAAFLETMPPLGEVLLSQSSAGRGSAVVAL